MTETLTETAPGPPQVSGSAANLEARTVPIHLTASPDLVDLALAYVADGSISNPETPALLRQIASEHFAGGAAYALALGPPAPPRLPITDGLVLVDYEIRSGVRGYRLAKPPANVLWRIRLGAFERHVHRTFVVLARRLVRFLTASVTVTPVLKAGFLAPPARAGGREWLKHARELDGVSPLP